MVSSQKYTVADISVIREEILNSYATFLQEETHQKIVELEKIIQQFALHMETNEKTPRKSLEKTHMRDERRVIGKYPMEKRRISEDNENWNAGKSFKATPKLVKNDTDKNITDIRMALNKLTTKNYEIQCNVIIELIQQIMVESFELEHLQKIAKMIFDIASSNKILSEIYAELYKKLISEFPQFQSNIEDLLENYRLSLHEIHFADPNKDYDGYCKYTKTNDTRKAMTMFIVNLMRKGILTEKSVLETTIYLEKAILKYAEEPEKNNEVEEITENLFILITQCVSIFKDREDWIDKIIPAIHELSKLKKTDGNKYPSMSNRATFKYMDILDALN